ncbi:sex-lethal homolog [Ctenocephalides felis]|uniref:sex-lethal homolog n=1 Tax=Ctenocephalides felis TaxID=7515 RepID=UPI000E6E3CC1|nr:sex-lethal homolog [Ctenocephalides felis]
MSWNSQVPHLSRTHSMICSSRSNINVRESPRTNLIVNYLPSNMTESELYNLFVTIGPLESCKIMRDIKTGYSYGFGFVNYMTEDHALRAIATLNGYLVQNKRIKVSFARETGEEIRNTNLYVSNLPKTITEYQLDVIFGKYGNIVNKHILREKHNGMPKGMAFVRFDKREEAQEAISALNNVIPDGGTQPLNVRLADEFDSAKYSSFFYNNTSRRVNNYLSSSRDYNLCNDYGRNSLHHHRGGITSGGGSGNHFVSPGGNGVAFSSSFGPGSFRSGSALSLTSGSLYGGLNNYVESPQQPYYTTNSTGGHMYRAGYTGSLNRGYVF